VEGRSCANARFVERRVKDKTLRSGRRSRIVDNSLQTGLKDEKECIQKGNYVYGKLISASSEDPEISSP
jgi:hypothetical protein